jgi:uncharacterized protein YndB with AHSA1/START domain
VSIVHHSFTIERRFGCTPEQAFTGFSDPELKRRWFGGAGAGWELDFRVGGAEVSRGEVPGGGSYAYNARYHDIVDGERIVYAYDMTLNDRPVSVSLATFEFHPDGSGTRLVMTEQGAFFDELDDPELRVNGTGGMIDALGRVLEEAYAGERV